MATPSDPAAHLTRVLDATAGLVAGVDDEQWTAPTPCADWTVRDLLNHLIGGNRAFAALLSGQAPPDRDSEHVGDDPAGSYRRSGEELVEAFARPGVLDTMVTVPVGAVPGVFALHLRLTENLVHGWDLARATGQSVTRLPADLAEQEFEFTRQAISRHPAGQFTFAPPVPVPDDAPAIDRLAALLGRSPTARFGLR